MREILFEDRYGAKLGIRSHMISDDLIVIYTEGAVELDVNDLAETISKLQRKLYDFRSQIIERGGEF